MLYITIIWSLLNVAEMWPYGISVAEMLYSNSYLTLSNLDTVKYQ